MSAGFTPGPWQCEPETERPRPWVGRLNESRFAAMACGEDEAEAWANGHLIAAAPELYEALGKAMSAMLPLARYYELNDQRNGNLEVPVRELGAVLKATREATAVLAKARGEAQ